MIEWAEIKPTDKILEPSAGLGAIARYLPKEQSWLKEIDTEKVKKLVEMGYNVVCADFLLTDTRFDKIVMNPPFSLKGDRQADITHILHAWDLLLEGGILIAVVSIGAFFRSNKKAVDFRDWLKANNAEIRDNPEDTFKASGTLVKTKTIRVRKEEVTDE